MVKRYGLQLLDNGLELSSTYIDSEGITSYHTMSNSKI